MICFPHKRTCVMYRKKYIRNPFFGKAESVHKIDKIFYKSVFKILYFGSRKGKRVL